MSNQHRSLGRGSVFAVALVAACAGCGTRPGDLGHVVRTLAGQAGQSGSADGTGYAARFYNPTSVTIDVSGNLYVADSGNNAIRKVTPAGAVSTLAGAAGQRGSADGTGSAARFYNPTGVAVDASANLYVADHDNHAIRRITPTGVVSTLAGMAGQQGSADGAGSAARFYYPTGIASDGSGNLYVADSGNHTIRKVTPAGLVNTLAGSPGQQGSADGSGSAARFYDPAGVTVDVSGSVYVADSGNDIIRKITPETTVGTLAGSAGQAGTADGTGSAAGFQAPRGVAVDVSGHVYVADSGNETIRKISAGGEVSTVAGSAGQPGSADGTARFYNPSGVAVDGIGNVYVADNLNHTIRKITLEAPPVSASSRE